MQQTPTVGRIVHYQSHGSPNGQHKAKARAAIITEVPDDWQPGMPVSLVVMNPRGQYFDENVPYSESPQAGHWSWPPRV